MIIIYYKKRRKRRVHCQLHFKQIPL